MPSFRLNANVDSYSASTYHTLGINVDLLVPVFAESRIVGWSAHIIEHLDDNRLIRSLRNTNLTNVSHRSPTSGTYRSRDPWQRDRFVSAILQISDEPMTHARCIAPGSGLINRIQGTAAPENHFLANRSVQDGSCSVSRCTTPY